MRAVNPVTGEGMRGGAVRESVISVKKPSAVVFSATSIAINSSGEKFPAGLHKDDQMMRTAATTQTLQLVDLSVSLAGRTTRFSRMNGRDFHIT